MKGNISLEDFIKEVKKELVAAQNSGDDAFYELESVELEVSFALEFGGGAKGKLVVVELGSNAKAAQTHKVRLNLKPIAKPTVVQEGPPLSTGGGGASSSVLSRPKYAPSR